MDNKTKMLFEPVELGPYTLKNRMIMAPMWTRFCSVNGEVTQQLIDYYVARAKGGVAMIVQEATAVDGRHTWIEPQIRIDHDKYVPGLHRLVEAVHLWGVLIFAQLHSAGIAGAEPVAPSDVPCWGLTGQIQPRAMTLAEVEETRDLFIAAALRAREAGYDGVELHGATSYLLAQFFSPHTNRRTDRYGGTLEKRMTLALEILRGIRQKCGPDFPVGYGAVHDELLPDGVTLEQTLALAKRLEREGAVYIHTLHGTYETMHRERGRGMSMRQKKGIFDISQEFKKQVNIRALSRSMGEHNPLVWEEALQRGQTDGVLAGRALLCDPELPKKVREGRLDDIRTCIRCGHCYQSGVVRGHQLHCALNPELGKEREYAIERKVASPRRVLVIGGGPGGLESARVAALRGHSVMLVEKAAELGGNVITASVPIGKGHLRGFTQWQGRECSKAGVSIELNREATPEVVGKVKPDVVIVATGAVPLVPQIPGVNQPHVVTAEDVLTGKAAVGTRVVVIGGRGLVGVETADLIAEKGLAESVTIIARSSVLAADMENVNRAHLMQVIMPGTGIKVLTNTNVEEITSRGVVVMDKQWKKYEIEADTIVLARGYTPDKVLYEQLKGRVPELYLIGDALKPRGIRDAVAEGAHIARQI